MRIINYLIFLFIVFAISTVKAQTDNTFWFAAPDVSSDHGTNPKNGAPINLNITAVYATHVTISRPADPAFPVIEFDLDQMERRVIRLDNYPGVDIDDIETYPMPDLVTGIQQKGFLIESWPGEVTAYYELDNEFNRDIFPLKGKNALGTDFWVSTQNVFPNGNYSGTAFSGFVIVATEDNTTVTVEQNAAWYYFPAPGIRTITLNRGETFAFRATGTLPADHINGVHVTADKKIAITQYDDSVRKKNISNGSCNANISYDIIGDQTVPTNVIGYEYVVMKGEIVYAVGCDLGERIFITATKPNTVISIDGLPVTTIPAAGGMYSYILSNDATHVRGSEPIYIFHASGFGGELGGAVLPTIDGCTGSNDVTFSRTLNSNDGFFMNLMVRNDTNPISPYYNQAINNFTLTVDGVTDTIPSAYFEYIMSGAFAVIKDIPAADAFFTDRIDPGDEARVSNRAARFHMGMINGATSTGCKYGYFSDYASSPARAGLGGMLAGTQDVYCDLDPIHLVAFGGNYYEWECISDPSVTSLITDVTDDDPYFYPDTTGDFVFSVKIYGECAADTTISMLTRVDIGPTSDFVLSANEGCSPFTVTITNQTNPVHADEMVWVFDDPYQEIDQTLLPLSFNYSFPNNLSDTIKTYQIQLYSYAENHACQSIRTKTVKVKPEIFADFEPDTNQGCHPLVINFTNNSTGDLDSTSYYWDFGDFTQSFDLNPDHTFDNYDSINKVYTVELVTESPYGCLDSINKIVTVHPRIRTAMAIDTSLGCSPMNITIDPGNSIGVKTYQWNFTFPANDSLFTTTTADPVSILYTDPGGAPDTILVNLVGINNFGCTDTFPTKNIVVFPLVTADFSVDEDSLCDGGIVTFTNNSSAYKPFYSWDFDDGTLVQDTTKITRFHAFYNRDSTENVHYNVSLKVSSSFFCEKTYDTVIVVHPFVRAAFGMDYGNSCTPVEAEFSNLSLGADNYYWDFGDDSTSTNGNPSFTHTYWNESGLSDTIYLVQMIAFSDEGCSDTLNRTVKVLPHVIADFSLNPDTVGCAPFTVGFVNNSSGGLSYLWDFGNGTSSTNLTPANRIFNNFTNTDTTYNISLKVLNSYGCDDSLSRSIEVFALIDANFNLPIADSCSPFVLRPDNLSSTGANFFEWDLLNSSFATENTTIPNFGTLTNDTSTTTGIYDLRLIAYGANDPAHRACADTHNVQVLLYPELDIDFGLDMTQSCQPFISTITPGVNIPAGNTFEWVLDNTFYSSSGTPPSLNVSNLTDSSIIHTLRFSGSSQHGCRDTATHTFEVYSLVDAGFTINRAGICHADSFQIDRRTSQGGIDQYEWNLGSTFDTRDNEVFNYTFANIGNSLQPTPITLTVYNPENCADSITRFIDVYPQVRANYTVDSAAVCYPYTHQFTSTTENASYYNWDFGDGTGSNIETPTHQFENFNNITDESFDIRLIARSQYNCYDSVTGQVAVYAKPDAEFSFPVTVDCPPFEAQMVNESEGFDLSYFWNFDDGSTGTDENPSHLFVNNGSTINDRLITLTVTSGGSKGCVDMASRTLRVYPNVEVALQPSITQGCTPLNVQFTGSATNVSNMLWSVDGQPFSTLANTSYRFVNQGTGDVDYNITLKGTSEYNCFNDTSVTITVFPGPVTEFYPDPLVVAYNTELDQTPVTFYNQTPFQNNWAYEWNYGDGNTDNQAANQFEYFYGDHFWGSSQNGNEVPIILKAWNNDNPECRDSVTYLIQIKPPAPQVALEENIAGCEPFTVEFNAVTKYVNDDQLNWDLGVPGAVTNELSPVYTYDEQGTYTVRLLVEGDGGSAWATRLITVHPKPEVDFSFNDSIVFVQSQNRPNEIINFYNHTKFGQVYEWYFNNNLDGGVPDLNEMNPTWHYEQLGTFYVALVANSGEGCVDTMISSIPIRVMGEASLQFPTGFFVDPAGARDEYVSDPMDPDLRIFRPYAQGVEEYKLEIYNRWGVLIFESHDVTRGWNGYLNGSPAKQDVYVWRAKGRFTNGQPFEMSGDVTLIVAPVTGVTP